MFLIRFAYDGPNVSLAISIADPPRGLELHQAPTLPQLRVIERNGETRPPFPTGARLTQWLDDRHEWSTTVFDVEYIVRRDRWGVMALRTAYVFGVPLAT